MLWYPYRILDIKLLFLLGQKVKNSSGSLDIKIMKVGLFKKDTFIKNINLIGLLLQKNIKSMTKIKVYDS